MPDLLAARSQMAVSLAFHIIFAEIGIAMPLMMVVAEWRARRTKDVVYLELARRWAKGTAILFATHNLDLVRRNPSIRLVELAQGQIIHDSALEGAH